MRLAGWKSRQMLARYGASAPTSGPATPTSGSARAIGYSYRLPWTRGPLTRGLASASHFVAGALLLRRVRPVT